MLMDSSLTKIKQESSEKLVLSTNEVLVEEKNTNTTPTTTTYYLPCYVRFKVKAIEKIDISGLQGTINGTLLFSFYYGNLDRSILDQFVRGGSKSILIQFSRQQSLQLKEDKGIVFKQNEDQKMIDFVIRQDFVCNLEGDVFYTPFEIINLYLTVTIHSVFLDPKENDGRRIDIKFNCMTSKDSLRLSYSENCKLGNYDLAQSYLESKYTNSQNITFNSISMIGKNRVCCLNKVHGQSELEENQHIKRQESICQGDDEKIKHFQYVHFRVPLYKYPGASLINIFLPLWVLGFINLLIFFQDIALSGRIGAIATLTLAFIAFIPTINNQIPQTHYIKGVEILIYMQTLASMLCLIQSLSLSQNQDPATYVFQWRQDAFFITALIFKLLTIAIVLFGFVLHKCYWEKVYNKPPDDPHKKIKLQRQRWGNPQCDKEFSEHNLEGRILVL